MNLEERKELNTRWGRLVSLVPPSIKKRLGALKDRIEGVLSK